MGIFKTRLSLDKLASFLDVIPAEHEQALGIKLPNNTWITIKDQFKAHYHKRKDMCKYYDDEETVAKHKFLTIYYDTDTQLIIQKLGKYFDEEEHMLSELGNFSLYQDETKYIGTNDSNGSARYTSGSTANTRDNRNMIDGILSGRSDMGQLTSLMDETKQVINAKKIIEANPNKHLNYLDPNSKEVTHQINVYGGTSDQTNTINGTNNGTTQNLTKTNSMTTITNPFKDRMTYINMEVKGLREKFLEQFRCMFITY